MKASDAFPSRYLTAADLDGKDVTLVIDRVEEGTVGQGAKAETKPILHFRKAKKALVLNKTNFNTIAKVLGIDDTDDWGGEAITLYPTETEYQGEMIECIRVRTKKPAAPKKPPVEDADDSEDEQRRPVKPPAPKAKASTLGIDDDSVPF